MRTLLILSTLLCSSAVLASDNPVQQAPMPMAMDVPLAMPVVQQDSDAAPEITPEMLRLLMQQAEQQAGQEAEQAREDTSNARINDTQR